MKSGKYRVDHHVLHLGWFQPKVVSRALFDTAPHSLWVKLIIQPKDLTYKVEHMIHLTYLVGWMIHVNHHMEQYQMMNRTLAIASN